MDVKTAIQERESCRSYTSEAVDYVLLEQCLASARFAPSACNGQPWHFVVVDQPADLGEVREAVQQMGMNPFVKNVTCFIVILEEMTALLARFGGRLKNQDYTAIDLGLAAAHFCLQATELGLGTCILGWFDEARLQRLLGLPEKKRVRLVIAVGYPETQTTRVKQRKSLDEMRSYRK